MILKQCIKSWELKYEKRIFIHWLKQILQHFPRFLDMLEYMAGYDQRMWISTKFNIFDIVTDDSQLAIRVLIFMSTQDRIYSDQVLCTVSHLFQQIAVIASNFDDVLEFLIA